MELSCLFFQNIDRFVILLCWCWYYRRSILWLFTDDSKGVVAYYF